MYRILRVNKYNRYDVIRQLESDIIRHVFAYYDIQFDFEHSIMYVTLEDNRRMKGYILIYTALDNPSVILEGDEEIAEKLIKYAPKEGFIMHIPPNIKPIVRNNFPDAMYYVENWMLTKRGEANFYESNLVRRLRDKEDALKLAALLSSQKNRPKPTWKKCLSIIRRNPTFGVFINGELVSYAGSILRLPQVWVIGGVYTDPKHRNRGYATLATSAITKEALKNAETAVLFVRSDNKAAIRVYEKIGYRKIGEKLWVDVKTGLKP